MSKQTVLLITIAIVVLIVGWDIYLYLDNVPGNSISQVIIGLSSKSNLLPWFIGLIMGWLGAHWFDNYTEPR